ncbi:MAG: helix-turn-helix transcriptional regulator [Clostridia bacterium]|nr:helix-turn-helix transcriptional regulator [Clostridia bacterium]
MAVSYNKLWKMLIDKGMSRTQMRLKAGISTKALAKLGKNESVNIDILIKICAALNCDITDIMEIVDNKSATME